MTTLAIKSETTGVNQQQQQEPVFKTGGITSPKGFLAAGAYVGIKKIEKPDLALLWSEVPANCAAVFTTNVMKAAPILWNQKALAESSVVSGIVINSGNANACTGDQGMTNAVAMASTYAGLMGCSANQILVASTGVIGVQLPIEKLLNGIKSLHSELEHSPAAGADAATAIMTTDTCDKQFSLEFIADGKTITIGAMAKGSGMIHPNMATMLGFVTTDLNIAPALLSKALQESNAQTYNMISVDGDTSTNDMVTIMANGQAGNTLIETENDDYFAFCNALNHVNTAVAKSIVQDGEGATKFIEVQIDNAATVADARTMARSVVSSSLVKAAFFGEDANWGRIICAMGYSGAKFDPAEVSISMTSAGGTVGLMLDGAPTVLDEELAKKVLSEKKIVVNVTLKTGSCSGTAWGCDLSYDYVKINGAYRT